MVTCSCPLMCACPRPAMHPGVRPGNVAAIAPSSCSTDSYTQLSTIQPEQPTAPVCVCEHIDVRVSQTAHKNRLVPLSVWTQQPPSAKSRSRLLQPKIKSHPSQKYHHFLNLIPFIVQNLPTFWTFCGLARRINKWIPAETLKDQRCTEGCLFALSQRIKLLPFLPSRCWTCAVLQHPSSFIMALLLISRVNRRATVSHPGTSALPESCNHQIKTFRRELEWDP